MVKTFPEFPSFYYYYFFQSFDQTIPFLISYYTWYMPKTTINRLLRLSMYVSLKPVNFQHIHYQIFLTHKLISELKQGNKPVT